MTVSSEDLSEENWEKGEECILKSELVFPPPIRAREEDYLEILHSENSIAKIIKINGKYGLVQGKTMFFACSMSDSFL